MGCQCTALSGTCSLAAILSRASCGHGAVIQLNHCMSSQKPGWRCKNTLSPNLSKSTRRPCTDWLKRVGNVAWRLATQAMYVAGSAQNNPLNWFKMVMQWTGFPKLGRQHPLLTICYHIYAVRGRYGGYRKGVSPKCRFTRKGGSNGMFLYYDELMNNQNK